MAEMKARGLKGFGKMGEEFPGKGKPVEKGFKVGGEEPTGETHIAHHADGSHTVTHHDGEVTEHPNHLHMVAELAHKHSGGDKHHIVHSDGMTHTSHVIGEDGEHDGPKEHNSAEEAKESLGRFLDEEAEEPEHEHMKEAEGEPAYGGL